MTQVANGKAPREYQDAEQFFARTFITEGMRLLLGSVAERLTGKGGDPVIQLQTAFGGGKTHTMLAVYHLASRNVSTDRLQGIPPILDAAGISELPQARVAVIDGINLSVSQPREHGSVSTNTLWGELAWQLLGEEGYNLVEDSDRDGTSPGKEALVELLTRSAPCVVLIDELVAFLRQLEVGKQFKAGTFDSNITFVQALTEAFKAVPNAILLASLPESALEVGGTMGQKALDSLEKYFARVESVWKPVATEEAFEIVRRRLFEFAGETAQVQGIAQQYTDFYRKNAHKFPNETQSAHYYDRLCQSYPIHPEVFDRLYEDWSTLDKFQRTRGVLQYMAIVIHRLWVSDNRDALIMPGSLPLDDSIVRGKSIHYLPQGWEPVIEKEVDGPRSEATEIDKNDTRFGQYHAARRVMRTLFLGSAPSSGDQMHRGLQIERVLLGACSPEQTIGTFEDVLLRLRDRLTYLYGEKDRLWLDTKPNLRREMETRKGNINEREVLIPLIKKTVTSCFGSQHCFAGIHVFAPATDVPDEFGTGPRLIVLPPETISAYSRSNSNNLAFKAAENILLKRGEQPRVKQNRLFFLAADYDSLSRLKEQGKIYLAWLSIVQDIENGVLNQDLAHLTQAKSNRDSALQRFNGLVRDTYKWLMAPFQEPGQDLVWETAQISSSAPKLVQEIENRLIEEEWLIKAWSPVHLRNLLEKYYFTNGTHQVSAVKVWQDACQYLYMPRLVNDQVLRGTIEEAVKSDDFFAFAAGEREERYEGFAFGRSATVFLDENCLLISRESALQYVDKLKAEQSPKSADAVPVSDNGSSADTGSVIDTSSTVIPGSGSGVSEPIKQQFYGSVRLDPLKAKIDFATLMDEVVQNFTSQLGVDVVISVEINARSEKGFDANLQRAIKENCNMLNFGNAEFEE
ncbi:TPA: ATP-binding protein [Klebsiella pneumoniae]|nr:ATP-binding protein [Klebsiella pneumoniae]HBW4729382.1 ATP-binding protein [Klebsiella pneumoniae]HBW4801634.1 ATP-binding protein [Klebsiella pneumoniae]HBW5545855.1 ATP-binding protein [Klebsiella pneumoniae]HBW5818163.1 ATP-binding protein [Klebsiella pneumoniae]